MSTKILVLLAGSVFALSGCLENDTQRAVAGAAGGALVADAIGGNAVTGAVIGGAAGYFCDELNVPGCKKR
ncbi:MAG: hypothetical protein ACOY5U_03735 [Pseudomonadota bacterium]|jgi:ABC-type xylose transport system permease subunit